MTRLVFHLNEKNQKKVKHCQSGPLLSDFSTNFYFHLKYCSTRDFSEVKMFFKFDVSASFAALIQAP